MHSAHAHCAMQIKPAALLHAWLVFGKKLQSRQSFANKKLSNNHNSPGLSPYRVVKRIGTLLYVTKGLVKVDGKINVSVGLQLINDVYRV